MFFSDRDFCVSYNIVKFSGAHMIRQLETADSKQYYKIRLLGLGLHPEAFGTGAEDWSKVTDEQIISLLQSSNRDDFILGNFENGELVGVIGLKREKKILLSTKAQFGDL